MIPWSESGRLTLDRDGILWLWTDPGFRRLGPVAEAAGDVAEDLAGDAAELVDLWADAFDDRLESRANYRLAKKELALAIDPDLS